MRFFVYQRKDYLEHVQDYFKQDVLFGYKPAGWEYIEDSPLNIFVLLAIDNIVED